MSQELQERMSGRIEYPEDPSALREFLLNAVQSIAPVVADTTRESEADRTLAPAAVAGLRESGLLGMKSPRAVGGAEAHPALQIEVIEALTKIDSAAGWGLLIAGGIAARALATLPEDVVEEMVAPRGIPFVAGSLKPDGTARAVDGGFEVTGRWGWASGVAHADFVVAPVFLDDRSGAIMAVVPANQAEIHDNWFPLGMRGSGSSDFSLDRVFVPSRFASSALGPIRGGALYRLGYGSAAHEHGAFAVALAQTALDTVVETAKNKRRGYVGSSSVAEREVFQAAIAEAEMRIKAVRSLMVDATQRLFESAAEGPAPIGFQAEARAAATFCTSEAVAVTTKLFRFAGGSAVMAGNPLERIMRDLYTAQSHLFVSESAYENLGKLRLGLTDQAPLG